MEHLDLVVTDPLVRERLEVTAKYLAGLRDEEFTMIEHSCAGQDPADVLKADHDHRGCIAGHIPKIAPELTTALVESNELLTWYELAEAFIRQEGVDERIAQVLFSWLFNGGWWRIDNTRRAAVERVRIALDDGVPSAFAETGGLSPINYVRDHPGAPGVPRARDT